MCTLQVLAFYSLYEQCEQAVENSENWLKVQSPPASEPEPLKVQLERCQVWRVCKKLFILLDVASLLWGAFILYLHFFSVWYMFYLELVLFSFPCICLLQHYFVSISVFLGFQSVWNKPLKDIHLSLESSTKMQDAHINKAVFENFFAL